ncbi:MAG: helix-turn-helix transcriptional regulator [Ruminococcus sp.]|nr:helix-turn-helix transcriptional regulator [Ruminococcus sp.]
MSYRIDKIFKTITANPYQRNTYLELAPCEALKPYIHCFWYSKDDGGSKGRSLVIPDLCMDIILYEYNGYHADFCGINNHSFYSVNTDTEHFGIRFYAWAVALFADDTMAEALNAYGCTQRYFSDFFNQTAEEILSAESLYEKKRLAENYLLKKLGNRSINPSVLNSIVYTIRNNGKATVKNLADDNAVSNRKLERDFLSTTGVSPKQMINLIRYQLLWQDAVKRDFNVLDSVEKYGFSDQSHLLKEFKKYHGLTLTEARHEVLHLSHFYNT